MTFLDGAVNLAPGGLDNRLAETARMLARIHSAPAVDFPWRYFSFTNEETLAPPSWSKRPDLWEEAIRIRVAGPPEDSDVFLHRDYHPVNLLWEGAGLSGVVDWVNACAGPAGVDVAHCRTNLVLMYGVSVAERFRQAYFEVGDAASAYHPYWDIDSILDWAIPHPEFYPPWLEYGLENPGREVISERLEEYLLSILKRS